MRSVMLPNGTSNGVMMAEAPNIKNVLKMFEPTTFPMAISAFFLRAAMIDVANSGKEVPMETMVNPMILSEISRYWAMNTAPFTNIRPPTMRPAKPNRMNKMDFQME